MGTKRYYYNASGQVRGPYSREMIVRLRDAGELPEETLFRREGMTSWFPYRSVFGLRAVPDRLIALLTGIQDTGVDWRGFFSGVCKRHTWAEMREVFCADTQPGGLPLAEMSIAVPRPWLYSRVLLWGGILVALLLYALTILPQELVMVGLLPLAALMTPLALLVLTYEMNTRRDLSVTAIVRALIGVLVVAIPVSLISPGEGKYICFAALVEEPAKLLTVLCLAGMMRIRMNRILRAVLLGCAVGAAFGFVETCIYLVGAYAEGGLGGFASLAILRALFSSPSHALWTGIMAGGFALAQAEVEQRRHHVSHGMFAWSSLFRLRFWRIAIIPVFFHFLHNGAIDVKSEFPVALLLPIFLLPLLGAWVYGRFISVGFVQLHATQDMRRRDGEAVAYSEPWVWEPLFRRFSIRFDGCIGRRRYWMLLVVMALGITGLSLALAFGGEQDTLRGFCAMELAVLCVWSMLMLCSMTVRRLHDLGRSGWHALYLFPLNVFCLIPTFILGFLRPKESDYREKQDTPQPHAPTDNPEANPSEFLALARLPEGMMPCTACCVPDGVAKRLHCSTCGGTHYLPQAAKLEDTQVVASPVPWMAWKPTFKGRVARKTYWTMVIVLGTVATLPLLTEYFLYDETDAGLPAGMLLGILIYLVWGLGLTARRLHDVDRSGWWLLLLTPANIFFFLPSIILGLVDSRPGTNAWGENPKAHHAHTPAR